MLAYVLILLLHTGTFGVDGSLWKSLGTGWKTIHNRHQVVLPPGTSILVPSGNTNRCLWIVLGIGWCYYAVPMIHPWIISKEKYLSFHHKWCVGEMVSKYTRGKEIQNLNPGQPTCVYFAWKIMWLMFCFCQKCLGTGQNLHPILRALGIGYFTGGRRPRLLVSVS